MNRCSVQRKNKIKMKERFSFFWMFELKLSHRLIID
jgi:hypothetical protein